MAIAIVLVIVLALMILWQRRRLLSAGKDFGATDFQRDYEPPEERSDSPRFQSGYDRPDDGADDPRRR
jgi:hypothetical protein